jgi:hypothetical protein
VFERKEMPWEIKYRDKYTGQEVVHKHSHNEASARGWADALAKDNRCKAVCERITESGVRTHVVTVGDDHK